MGNTHVFSAPVLAYRPKMWSETWQQRNIALEPDSTLHVSHGAGGKASYTINLKLLSAENILFGRRQIRSLGASTSKPFPTDLYMDTTLNSLVDIDRAIIILDPSENAAQDGTDSSKSQKLHALAFTTQKDYFRFLVALTKMGLFRESLRDAMEHQPAHHAEHATAYEAAIKSSGGSNAFLKSISAGKGFSMSEMATVILVVLGFLWVLRYLLWTNEEDI